MSKENTLGHKCIFLHADHAITIGALLDGTNSKILPNIGATNQLYVKLVLPQNKSVHGLPKVSSKEKIIQVGNSTSVNILLIIANIITIQGHIFEI